MVAWIAGSVLGLVIAGLYSFSLGRFWKERWGGVRFSAGQLLAIFIRFGGVAAGLLLCLRIPGIFSLTAYLSGMGIGFIGIILRVGLKG